jgi:hypothetical protein
MPLKKMPSYPHCFIAGDSVPPQFASPQPPVRGDLHTAIHLPVITLPVPVNKPLTTERLTQQLSKLGDTVFYAESIKIDLDDNTSLPISEINSVRRKAICILEENIINSYKRNDAVR